MIDRLNPTELFFLENPKKITFQKFVTQTLVNLISENVIVFQKNSTRDSSFFINKYILIGGQNLEGYFPQKFENIFVAPFKVNPKRQIELNEYIKKIFDSKFDKWIKELANSDNLKDLITTTYILNKNGEKLNKELLNLIKSFKNIKNSKYFSVLSFNDSSSTAFNTYSNLSKENLFLKTDVSNIDFSIIDLIHEFSIRIFSDSDENLKRYEPSMNWKNYNAGGAGHAG